ncbi:MAG: hypothetical protein RMI04_05930 [Thermofilaceae archaeon]|nr:hypothetical protein [Thermofilaceae archaeon]
MLQSIARELAKRGHAVDVYSIPFRRAKRRSFKIEGYSYEESVFKKIDCDVAYYVYAPMLDKLLRTDAPKIAGVHNFTVWPKFSLENHSIPLIAYNCGPLAASTLAYCKLLRGRDITRGFDAVHVPNVVAPSMLNIPVYTIPNWYDEEVFKQSKTKLETFTILYVGSETLSKGFDIFLKIYEILSNKLDKIQFIVVGSKRHFLKKKLKLTLSSTLKEYFLKFTRPVIS